MSNSGNSDGRFFAGGFFWDADTRRVLLHLRDGNAPTNQAMWGFLGGFSKGQESPAECFCRVIGEKIGFVVLPEEAFLLRSRCNSGQRMRHVFCVQKLVDAQTLVFGMGAELAWHRIDDLDQSGMTPRTQRDLAYFVSALPGLLQSRT